MLTPPHKRRATWLSPMIALLSLVFPSLSASAQSPSSAGQLRLNPAEVKAAHSRLPSQTGSSRNPLVQEVVLRGDPSQKGLYTILLKVGPHARIAAHSHPDDRIATVISGTWYFGYGSKFDAGKVKRLPAGSVYAEPAHANHFAMTHGPVIVEITGYGPSGVSFVKSPHAPPHMNKHRM
ncbi:MAG: cupin domain-containing protein [Capsulimonas sp.]|uniref:cupin domain-containing protein n=1 Tax=Capsulimonas sp. TaxID=2494211 RepID=UPI0032678D4A